MNSIKNMADHWWLVLVKGIIGVLLGLAFLAWPGKSAVVITVLIGLYVMIDSVFAVILGLLSIKKDDHWWVMTVMGVFGFFAGIAILNWPQITLALVIFLLSLWAFVVGIMMLTVAVRLHRESYGSWFFVAIGILSLVVGMLLIANPVESVKLLTVVAGFFVFLSGVFTTAYAFELHHLRSDLKKIA
jgi:uncharacterized membrane protein HdeD (DUF308 family)